MSSPPAYTMTNESITVVHGGKTYAISKGSPQFLNLRKALVDERWDDVPKHLTVSRSLEAWARDKFTLERGTFLYEGKELPKEFNNRIISMATGNEDPEPLFKFWERLQRNPSFRSVQQLWGFMVQKGIPLTKDGCFLAYKSVTESFMDHHSKKIDNTPGTTNELPRNQISDDPNLECHFGFHVGAIEYARSFGSDNRRIIICKVDPADVVCVPRDCSSQKMRVCKYRVVGNWNGQHMPSTTIDPGDYGDEPLRETIKVGSDECLIIEVGSPSEPALNPHPSQNPAIAHAPDPSVKLEDENHIGALGKVSDLMAKQADEGLMPVKPRLKKWEKFDAMELTELMQQSLDDLRQYAGKGLNIVGASKVLNGKTGLTTRILEVRWK